MKKILVFGSNTQGRHGKGAALEAKEKWGAIYGKPRGLQGSSYAIVTKELRTVEPSVTKDQIKQQVDAFLSFAKYKPDWTFILTPIGCGLAGFTPDQIGPMFRNAPSNIEIPKEFQQYIQ